MHPARILFLLLSIGTLGLQAQDWPQWRGPSRDAHAAEFKAPKTWPKELTRKWNVTVGEGVSTPALVGDRLYVFSRQEGFEVTRCLSVAKGEEIWQEKYESFGASGPSSAFSGPRSSPAVAQGKVVTIGVRGVLSVLDAATGARLWRKDDVKGFPTFHPASSPLIHRDMVIAQLGGRDDGALVAYDLATGAEKWKWSGPSPSYASPAMLTVGGDELVLAQTEAKLVAVKVSDGSLAWESAAAASEGGRAGGPGQRGGRGGGGRDYRASSPVVDGQTFYLAGRGVKAARLEKEGDKYVAKELWTNSDKSVQFNTPTLKDGKLFALASNSELFCLDAKTGETLWTAPFPGLPAQGGPGRAGLDPEVWTVPASAPTFFGQATPAEPERPRRGGPGGGRGGGMGGGMRPIQGYGSLVDVGEVMLALTPAGQLLVLDPGATELKTLATYKVAEGQTYAYPVASGNRIFVRDADSVILWTLE